MAVTTVYTYDLNGSKKDFDVPFEYLARRFVQVTLIGQDRKPLDLASDFRFTGKTSIQTLKAWGPADGYERIEIRRNTSATDRLVDFADGSILRANELNTSQVQTLHVAEEARNMVVDTIGADNNGNLDARGRRIVNTADGVEPGDAVTLRQEQAWAASTLGNRNASEAARDRSVTAQAISESKAAEAMVSATASKSEADRSKSEADRSAAAAGTIGGNVEASTAQAERAKTEADRARAQADIAKVHAETSVTKAGEVAANTTTVLQAKNEVGQALVSARAEGAPPGSITFWPGPRSAVPAGWVALDGQLSNRAEYPTIWALVSAGSLPSTLEANWAAATGQRAKFTLGDGVSTFRWPDYNSASHTYNPSGLFLRGGRDSLIGSVTQDTLQDFRLTNEGRRSADKQTATHFMRQSMSFTFNVGGVGAPIDSVTESAVPPTPQANPWVRPTDARIGTETAPVHANGVWIMKAYGAIANQGSYDAAQAANAIAGVSARAVVLEDRVGWRTLASQDVAGKTQVSFTGLPSWANKVEVDLWQVRMSQTALCLLRGHTASGALSTGYDGLTSAIGSGNAHRAWDTGIYLTYSDYESSRRNAGTIVLSRTTGGWTVSGVLSSREVGALTTFTSGTIGFDLTGISLLIPNSAAYTFAAGWVTVRYRI